MSWPFGRRVMDSTSGLYGTADEFVAQRTAGRSTKSRNITRDQALKHSAVWACLRLRADLVSTMPVEVYRTVGDLQVPVPASPVLVNPGGSRVDMLEWLYSTQIDLDSCGNTFGLISAVDGLGFPARIDLLPATSVVVQVRNGQISYNVSGTVYQPAQIWHERQFTTSGVPVGLSPIAYAASSINGYLSAQAFAADWFSGTTAPAGVLKNKAKTIKPDEARVMKDRFKATMQSGDVFVTGSDWDYSIVNAAEAQASFIEERQFGVGDVCRFLGVPGDMIDAQSAKGTITYANVTQRNLQLLIMNLNPAVIRREAALSRLTPAPRKVKLDRASVLAMDQSTRFANYAIAIGNKWMAPSEVRDKENLPPLTPEQIDEIDHAATTGAPPAGPPATVPAAPAT